MNVWRRGGGGAGGRGESGEGMEVRVGRWRIMLYGAGD